MVRCGKGPQKAFWNRIIPIWRRGLHSLREKSRYAIDSLQGAPAPWLVITLYGSRAAVGKLATVASTFAASA